MSMSQLSKPGVPRVLIVEDEPLIALDLQDMLRDVGYQVAGPAPSIDAALDLLSAGEEIAAAVLDLNLHQQLSTPVAAELRRRGIPFCLCTAYQKLLPRTDDFFEGITVLGKPIVPRQLLAELGCLIDMDSPTNIAAQ